MTFMYLITSEHNITYDHLAKENKGQFANRGIQLEDNEFCGWFLL